METLRIVIADNESIIRMDLKELLEEAGHTVVGEAADGVKAVELARKHKPDLVIMDIKMPEMDGIAASKIISAEKIAPVFIADRLQPEGNCRKSQGFGGSGVSCEAGQRSQPVSGHRNCPVPVSGVRANWSGNWKKSRIRWKPGKSSTGPKAS